MKTYRLIIFLFSILLSSCHYTGYKIVHNNIPYTYNVSYKGESIFTARNMEVALDSIITNDASCYFFINNRIYEINNCGIK
jgi:hypothetical protein